jgi:hypothetical protein
LGEGHQVSPRHQHETDSSLEQSPTPPPSAYGSAAAAAANPYAEFSSSNPYAEFASSSPYDAVAADRPVSPYATELAGAGTSAPATTSATAPPSRRSTRRSEELRTHERRERRAGRTTDTSAATSGSLLLEIPEQAATRAQARAGRQVPRVRRRWGRVAAVTAAVAGTVLLLGPITGGLPFGDKFLTVDDHRAVEPTVSPNRTPEPDPSGPWPETTPSLSPSASPSTTEKADGSPTASGTDSSNTAPRRTRRTRDTEHGGSGSSTSDGSSSSSRRGVVLDGHRVGGWYAGASGIGVADGSFAKWLGQPVNFAAFWADTDDEVQRTLPGLTSDYKNWTGGLDIAVGGTVLGSSENYASAASGAYDDRWRAAARVLAANRKNATGPTFVRPWHEMNGSWYKEWMVTSSNSADFKKAFARYVGILRQEMPQVYISWSPNWGDFTNLPVEQWYPGDAYVDCVAPDYYDDGNSEARFSVQAWNAESTDRDKNGNPLGVEAWRQFALQHGKPICFPEWGLKPEGDGVDHPEWIKAVNAWMNKNANTATWALGADIPKSAAGKVLYSTYFNVVHEGQSGFTIYGTGANPNSAAVFPQLKWGNQKQS